jgi:hypothetical protein
MDDRNTIGVIDDTNLQGLAVRGRSDEHGDVGIVGLEASPVVSQCMEHVVIGDTVLAGARLDVHPFRLRIGPPDRQHLLTTGAELLRSARTSRRRCE